MVKNDFLNHRACVQLLLRNIFVSVLYFSFYFFALYIIIYFFISLFILYFYFISLYCYMSFSFVFPFFDLLSPLLSLFFSYFMKCHVVYFSTEYYCCDSSVPFNWTLNGLMD